MKIPVAGLLLVYTVGIGVAAGTSATDVSSDSTTVQTNLTVSTDVAITTVPVDTSQGDHLTNTTAATDSATSVATSNATTSAEPGTSATAGGTTSVTAASASEATATVALDNSTVTQAPSSGSATTTSTTLNNLTVTQAPPSDSTTSASALLNASTAIPASSSGNATATDAAATTLTGTDSGNSSLTSAPSSGGTATSSLAGTSGHASQAASDLTATGDSSTSGAASSGVARTDAASSAQPTGGGSTVSATAPYNVSFASAAADAGQATSVATTQTGNVSNAADLLTEETSTTWSATPEPASTSWLDATATAGSPALDAASSDTAAAPYGSTGGTSDPLTLAVALVNGSMLTGGGGGAGAVNVTQSPAANSSAAAVTSAGPALATGVYTSSVGVPAAVTRVSGQTQKGTTATSGTSMLPVTSNFTQKTAMSSAPVGNRTSTGKQGVTVTASTILTASRSSATVANASASTLNRTAVPTKASMTTSSARAATNTTRSYNGTFAYVLLPEGPVIISRSYNITCIASKAEITLTLEGNQVPLTGALAGQGYYEANFEILTEIWHDGMPVDCYIVNDGVVYNDEKTFTVYYGPRFGPSVTSFQNSYVVKPEQTLRLWCRGALSNPPATYTWGFPQATAAERLADGGLMFTTSAAVPEYGASCTAYNAYTLRNATVYYRFTLLRGVELALRVDRPDGYSSGQAADITCFLAYRQPIFKISLISDSDNDLVACSKQDPGVRLSSEWDVARVSVDFGINDGRTAANYRDCRSLPWSSTLLEYVVFHVYGISSAAAGMYRCRVQVDSTPYTYADTAALNITAQLVKSSVTSIAQRIRVFEMPTLPRISGPTDVNEDQSYEYTCSSRNGRPPPQLTWMLGDSYYVNGMNRQPRQYDLDSNQGDSFTSIILAGVTQSMDGQVLKCVVTAHPLVDQRYLGAIRLNVNYGPRFRNPEDFDTFMTKSIYESLTLSCYVVSKPISRITWTMQRPGLVSMTISSENYFSGGRDMIPSKQYKLPGYTNFTCVANNPSTRKTVSGSFRVYFTKGDYFTDAPATQADGAFTTAPNEVIVLSSNQASDSTMGVLLTAIPLIALVCILGAIVGTLAYVAVATRGSNNKVASIRLSRPTRKSRSPKARAGGQKAGIRRLASPNKVAAAAAAAATTSPKHAHQRSPPPRLAFAHGPGTSAAGGSPGALRAAGAPGQVGGPPSPAVAEGGAEHPPGATRHPPAAAGSPGTKDSRAPRAASSGPNRRAGGVLNQKSGEPVKAASSPDKSRRAAANQPGGHGRAVTKTGSPRKSPPGLPGKAASKPESKTQPKAGGPLPSPPPGGRDGQAAERKTGKSGSPRRGQTEENAKEGSRSRDGKPATTAASEHRQRQASKTAERKKTATSVGAKSAQAAGKRSKSKEAEGVPKPAADPAQQPVNASPPNDADGATAART